MDEISRIENIILSRIQTLGSSPGNNWYLGITDDHERRLSQHNASETALVIETSAEHIARAAEQLLLEEYGFRGDTGGGKGNGRCIFIYIYPISILTKQ